jgi:hypothetical protein
MSKCRGIVACKCKPSCENLESPKNMKVYSNYVSERLGKSFQFDSIYTDFKKAFDLIDTLKLSQLPKCDISGPPLCCIRYQWVKVSLSLTHNG